MNRIILSYASGNTALANSIDQQLSRIGIPFEHVQSAPQMAASEEPVLLLVTDNFLLSRSCLEGLLPILKDLAAKKLLLVVLADGIDAQGLPVPTQIDRMSNALHYMKHWQDVWLVLSDEHQHAPASEKAPLVADLDANRGIANQVGDIIGTLREVGYLNWEQFIANDFELFFTKFNLQDWHGQYKRLVAQSAAESTQEESKHLPELHVTSGFLSPEPMEPEAALLPLTEDATPDILEEPQQDLNESIPAAQVLETPDVPELPSQNQSEREAQAARDAWFWIEKGHKERGLELFQNALEHFPESEWLQTEYEKAVQQVGQVPLSQPEKAPEEPAIQKEVPPTDEANSYDLMGEMAAERGDYLFAKYCWDRVVELNPAFPNIYRKLGLMTAEHLRDYQETATIYLHKALEVNGQDAELRSALAELKAEKNPGKRPEMQEVTKQSPPEIPAVEPTVIQPTVQPKQAVTSPSEMPLVLITGATSGIGRATAEIFARNGYRLILTGRRAERLEAVKNQLVAENGSDILTLSFDVRDQQATEAALTNLPESYQNIDILVNNAGLAKGLAPIHEGNLEHWETMIDTNLKGLLYVTRIVSPGMVRRRKGFIINICSSAGREAYPNGNVYCATKFGVDALTKTMRYDLHAHNVRVGQVSPGHVEETEFALTRFDGDVERAKIYKDFQPLKSSDVADAIFYMATRPPHVNIQDIQLFATQQASSLVIDRSGRS